MCDRVVRCGLVPPPIGQDVDAGVERDRKCGGERQDIHHDRDIRALRDGRGAPQSPVESDLEIELPVRNVHPSAGHPRVNAGAPSA